MTTVKKFPNKGSLVYKMALKRAVLTALLITIIATSTHSVSYSGECMREAIPLSVFRFSGSYEAGSMNEAECVTSCSDLEVNVAGITEGEVCLCGIVQENGNELTDEGATCDVACPGGSGICGGNNGAFNVFDVKRIRNPAEIEFTFNSVQIQGEDFFSVEIESFGAETEAETFLQMRILTSSRLKSPWTSIPQSDPLNMAALNVILNGMTVSMNSIPDGISGIALRSVSANGNEIHAENSAIFPRKRNSVEFANLQCGEGDFVESGIPFYCSVEWYGSGNNGGKVKFDDSAEKAVFPPENPILSVGSSTIPPNHFAPTETELIADSAQTEFVIFTEQSRFDEKITAVEWFGRGNQVKLKVSCY